MAWQWSSARSMAGEARTKLDQAGKQAQDVQARLEAAEKEKQAARDEVNSLAGRLKDFETTREDGGFDADRIYKLLAKSSMESPEGPHTYGVVQEDSGSVRPFLVDETLDHLEAGDCFGILRGKLAKLDEREFEVASGTGRPEGPAREPRSGSAPVTEVRPAAEATGETPDRAGSASQKTQIYVAAQPEQPQDPNKGLPYLVIQDGDKDGDVYHLAFDRLTAGRGADNGIVLQDQAASRVHFTVSFSGNRFFLEDNDSTNGTLCNGQTISRKQLEFGDRIQVGDTTIRFSCEGYDLKDENAKEAVAALEECVERQPDFIDALKLLAFMLERNVARKKEAASYWERIARLEKSS